MTKSENLSIWKELELAFGSSKFRVLLHLLLNHKDAFTKYALVKATGLRTPAIKKQLDTLIRFGWIKEYVFTPPTYQANLENAIVRHFLDFVQEIRLEGISGSI